MLYAMCRVCSQTRKNSGSASANKNTRGTHFSLEHRRHPLPGFEHLTQLSMAPHEGRTNLVRRLCPIQQLDDSTPGWPRKEFQSSSS